MGAENRWENSFYESLNHDLRRTIPNTKEFFVIETEEVLYMEMTTISMTVPEGIAPYLDDERNDSFERNAMLLYPFIQKGIISHGRAAEILGVRKWDLIEYYNSIGIPYLNQSKEELLAELATFDTLKEKK